LDEINIRNIIINKFHKIYSLLNNKTATEGIIGANFIIYGQFSGETWVFVPEFHLFFKVTEIIIIDQVLVLKRTYRVSDLNYLVGGNADLKPKAVGFEFGIKHGFFRCNLSSSGDNRILAAVKRIVPLSYKSWQKF
jgi:hypothetical protein